jgi:hypothetical protein
MALVRELNIPTEQPPLVGEVSANFADKGTNFADEQRKLISMLSTDKNKKTL